MDAKLTQNNLDLKKSEYSDIECDSMNSENFANIDKPFKKCRYFESESKEMSGDYSDMD